MVSALVDPANGDNPHLWQLDSTENRMGYGFSVDSGHSLVVVFFTNMASTDAAGRVIGAVKAIST